MNNKHMSNSSHPSLSLSSPVTDIPRVGPVKAEYLSRLGITHARDFLFTFPRKHDDFSNTTPIVQLKPNTKMTVRAKVKQVKSDYGWQGRRRLLRIFVDIEDDTGVLNVTWYNLRFLERQLWQGRELLVAGTVEDNPQYNKQLSVKSRQTGAKTYLATKFRMRSPVIEFVTGQDPTHTGRITPVYPETYGVTSRFLRYQVKNLLPLLKQIPEYLPADIIKRRHFLGIHQAIAQVHFPDTTEQLEQARRRLRNWWSNGDCAGRGEWTARPPEGCR